MDGAYNTKDQRRLWAACKKGDLATVTVKQYKQHLFVPDPIRRSPLSLATIKGHVHIAQYICEQHVQLKLKPTPFFILNEADKYGRTPLYFACERNQLDILRYLLDKGANPRQPCFDGKTPTIAAASGGHLNILLLLSTYSSEDLTLPDNYGRTPMFVACANNHLHIVKYLCRAESGAKNDLLKMDNLGETPFYGLCTTQNYQKYEKWKIIRWAMNHDQPTRNSTRMWLREMSKGSRQKLLAMAYHNRDYDYNLSFLTFVCCTGRSRRTNSNKNNNGLSVKCLHLRHVQEMICEYVCGTGRARSSWWYLIEVCSPSATYVQSRRSVRRSETRSAARRSGGVEGNEMMSATITNTSNINNSQLKGCCIIA